MNAIINITEQNGNQVVSARELHVFLEVTTPFRKWIERMLEYGFEENQDFTRSDIFVRGNEAKDYALTMHTAKEISMLQRTEKGKQARKYFIECEKKIKQPLSQIDILIQSAQLIKEQEKRISVVENKVLQIEAQTKTRSDYFTIVGYATLNGVACGLKIASSLGKKASALCKQRNIPTESLPDPRFGIVKTYPLPVLEEVFTMNL